MVFLKFSYGFSYGFPFSSGLFRGTFWWRWPKGLQARRCLVEFSSKIWSFLWENGSMVLVYMVTWIPSIYPHIPLYVSINIAYMDPMCMGKWSYWTWCFNGICDGDSRAFFWGFNGICDGLPSGKQTICELENDPVEIVSFPIKNGDFP